MLLICRRGRLLVETTMLVPTRVDIGAGGVCCFDCFFSCGVLHVSITSTGTDRYIIRVYVPHGILCVM